MTTTSNPETIVEAVSPTYLTPREVAEMLRVPLKTVYTWQSEGTGPSFYRVGKYALYIESEVHAWVRSRSVLQR